MDNGSWTTTSVAECLVPVSVRGKTKIHTRGYKPSGRFPIIDQGQDPIAGWTDDESAVIDEPLPLIVFGDHTRAFKFADVPFARGADGTQLLRPKSDIDPLFFFYACRAIDLSARGYNRHFTILKGKEISFPIDDKEQKAIGSALCKVESALAQQSELLSTVQELKRAAMRALFTRGLRGEPQKETDIGPVPESWETPNVSEAVRPFRFERSKQIPKSAYRILGHWPILDQSQNFIAGFVDDETKIIRSVEPLIVFGDHTRTFKFVDFECALGADGTKPLLASDGFEPKYLFHALCNLEVPARGYNRHYTVLSEMLIPKPGSQEQRGIVAILDAIDGKMDLHKQKRAVLEDLFKALLHKLMTGEIRVDELDLPAPRMAEMEVVA